MNEFGSNVLCALSSKSCDEEKKTGHCSGQWFIVAWGSLLKRHVAERHASRELLHKLHAGGR